MADQHSRDAGDDQNNMIPYGKQWIDEDDIEAVVKVLRSDWLTTGPKIEEFEATFARVTGTRHAVAVSSGTAALHAAIFALEIGLGDEVIVPSMTFAASANCVVYQGGTPVFVDVEPDTLLVDPAKVEAKITSRTRAIISVDYAGQPCDYYALRTIAERHKLTLVDDACHALGGQYRGRPVGSLADVNVFSFHPMKHITTGEGGMITTDNPEFAGRMRMFRNHGITSDHHQRDRSGSWFYEMMDLGYNLRLTDIQCALGLSQLKKLPRWVKRRREIASIYDRGLSNSADVKPLAVRPENFHAYHLYVTRLDDNIDRQEVFSLLRKQDIGVNVHYIPVHMHPFYRQRLGTGPGLCPVAESAYEHIISLPMFPRLIDDEIHRVISTVSDVVKHCKS
jgi:perosamine synthetase